MNEHLPLFVLALGLATGLVSSVYVANFAQARRLAFLRHLLSNILLFNLLILASMIFNYVQVYSRGPGTSLPPVDPGLMLGAMMVLKGFWVYVFLRTTTVLGHPQSATSGAKLPGIVCAAVTSIFVAALIAASALDEPTVLQMTIHLFEVVVIATVLCAALLLIKRGFTLPRGGRRTSLLAFGAWHATLFATILLILTAAWALPGPQSATQTLVNGVLLTLYNVFPPLWLRTAVPAGNDANDALLDSLGISPREREVIRQICDGLTNREIADRLNISVATVKDHNHNVFLKCGVRNRLELVNLVTQHGDTDR